MPASIPPAIATIESSRIREVSLSARGIDNIIPLWFGESDQATPDFIRSSAISEIEQGLTLYSLSSGIAPLHQTLNDDLERLHGKPFELGRITVTSSGMQGCHADLSGAG